MYTLACLCRSPAEIYIETSGPGMKHTLVNFVIHTKYRTQDLCLRAGVIFRVFRAI